MAIYYLSSMSPRPRTVSDAQILYATQRAMSRLGPTRMTLAAVAKEAGLSAATLVQRFGSKRGLMLALWATALDGIDGCFDVRQQIPVCQHHALGLGSGAGRVDDGCQRVACDGGSSLLEATARIRDLRAGAGGRAR